MSNIPDLIKIGSIPSNTAIRIETDILDVTNFSQNNARFVFDSKGFLHPNSKLTLSVDTTGLSARSFYALNTGVAQLLSRVRLSCGGKTLQEIDDFSHWFSYRSLFVDNEIQKNKELYTGGRCINHNFLYKQYHPDKSNTEAENLVLDIGKSPTFDGVDTNEYTLYDFQIIGNKAIFQINLSEMCPILKMNQMPLYLIDSNNPLVLDLTFTNVNGTGRACITEGESSTETYNIKQDDLKIIADYMFYPQEFMDEYRVQNPSLTFTYMDYQLSKTSLTHITAKTLIRNIGGNGRIVTKVITGLQNASTINDSLLNDYVATSPSADYASGDASKNGSLTANVKYNNEFLFPIDVKESSVLFHHTQQAEAVPPFITRDEYNREGNYLTSASLTMEGHNLGNNLKGNFFWQSFRLNKQERISSRGIELYYNYDGLASSTSYTQRAYLEVVKMATLVNGNFSVTFA
jgi:hypothetical protein